MRGIKRGRVWVINPRMWIISFLLLLCLIPSGVLAYTFVTQWGPYGTDDGQLGGPKGIAVDAGGNVYVAEEGNMRVQKFTSNGDFLMKWGTSGTDDGQFITPHGIAVDPEGNVYVTDAGRIQKFSSTGTFLKKLGGEGCGDGEFLAPDGISVDGNGYVYIVDSGNQRIQKLTSDGNFITKWGTFGTGNGELQNPHGIAADSGGNVYVADHHRIQKFSSSGTYLGMLLSEGTGDEGFFNPEGIAVDGYGNVYVAERSNNRIQKFSSDGEFIEKWGVEGNGDGELRWPVGVAVDAEGYVYVLNFIFHGVEKFAPPPVAPTACFCAEPTSGLAPLVVQFDSCSTGLPDSYSWDFGDGGISTAVKPSHEYLNAGIYTVSLTVSNDYGSSTDTSKIIAKSLSEAIQDITSYIKSLQLKQGTENSLIVKLEAAIKSIEKGNTGAAKNQLNACINEINAQKGRAIPNDQAGIIIAKLQKIIQYI